jgi:hypothetical protein
MSRFFFESVKYFLFFFFYDNSRPQGSLDHLGASLECQDTTVKSQKKKP